jgi:hypothetical protein
MAFSMTIESVETICLDEIPQKQSFGEDVECYRACIECRAPHHKGRHLSIFTSKAWIAEKYLKECLLLFIIGER